MTKAEFDKGWTYLRTIYFVGAQDERKGIYEDELRAANGPAWVAVCRELSRSETRASDNLPTWGEFLSMIRRQEQGSSETNDRLCARCGHLGVLTYVRVEFVIPTPDGSTDVQTFVIPGNGRLDPGWFNGLRTDNPQTWGVYEYAIPCDCRMPHLTRDAAGAKDGPRERGRVYSEVTRHDPVPNTPQTAAILASGMRYMLERRWPQVHERNQRANLLRIIESWERANGPLPRIEGTPVPEAATPCPWAKRKGTMGMPDAMIRGAA